MDYEVTYIVNGWAREVVLREVERITFDIKRGPKFRAFWGGHLPIAEFHEVEAVLPMVEKE